MMPIQYDFAVYQGCPWRSASFVLEDAEGVVDLTGYTGVSQVKKSPSSVVVLVSPTVVVEDDGQAFHLELTSVQTLTIAPTTEENYYYDAILSKTGDATSKIVPVAGSVVVLPRVSRE